MIGRLLQRAKAPTLQPVMPTMFGAWPFASTVTDAFVPVDEDTACDLAVVSGTLSIFTSLISQMPLNAYQGTLQVATPPVLRNPTPGPGMVLHDFLCAYIRSVVLHGNFVAVLGDPAWDGWPAVMYPVPNGQWQITPDGGYRIGPDVYAPADIFHVRTRCGVGEMVGRGLLQTHRRLLASAIAAEDWAQAYFAGGTAPPAVLTSANPELTQGQAEAMKSGLRRATRNREAVVVPAGTTITALSADADKAQLIESRRWGAQQLAMALGIPGALLGLENSSMTYRNIGEVFSQMVSTTIMSHLIPLEQQLTLQCLPRGTTARFSPEAILRPDLASRVELAVKGLTGDVYTPDEARNLLDLPPNPEATFDTPSNPVTADGSPTLAVVSEATR